MDQTARRRSEPVSLVWDGRLFDISVSRGYDPCRDNRDHL